MAYETLYSDESQVPVMVLAFNRPDTANALNRQMGLELQAFFSQLPKDCRAVVLTGRGKHFCAGADLKERKGMDESQWKNQHAAFEGALKALVDCPVPVIAAVNGAAFGGGLELALACDFIYASPNARFALTEATLGIMPGLGGSYQLARHIGLAHAKELVFTGRTFSVEEAFVFGMINRLCAGETLLDDALATAKSIAANAPLAVKAIKQALKDGDGLTFKEARAAELIHYNELLKSKDREEGINAFNEKRKPKFTGT